MKLYKSKTKVNKSIIVLSLLLTNVLHAKYNNINEDNNGYKIVDFSNNDLNYSHSDSEDIKKINRIRKQLIEDSDYVHIQDKRRTLSNHDILDELNVSSSFLNNKTFRKEIRRQQRNKPIILKNILSSNKKNIVKDINRMLHNDDRITNFMIYLALNESSFNKYAKSHVSATGVWQFMATTARNYNLKVNKYIDERTNVDKSTKAAITYLKDMNRFFKSWNLSIMAYNTGPGNVVRSYIYNSIINHCEDLGSSCNYDKTIKKHSQYLLNYDLYKGKKNWKRLEKIFKYYRSSAYSPSLEQMLEMKKKKKQYLPKETRNYIRRILACSIVYNDTLVDLGGFNNPNNKAKAKFKIHTVKKNETLSSIASIYSTSYKKIMRDNDLSSTNIIPNQNLKIY